MKKRLLFFAAAALAVLSCTVEERVDRDTIIAEIENLSTRTALEATEGGYIINWIAGDRITVTDGVSEAVYEAATGGSSSSEFNKVSGSVSGNSLRGYYPAELISGVLPSVQKWYPAREVRIPMATDEVSDIKLLKFKPICGVLHFTVVSSIKTLKIREIRVSADQPMSGPFVISDGVAALSGTAGVSLDCGEDGVVVGLEETPFCVSVPADTYTGLKITLVDVNGKVAEVKLQENAVFTVRRAEARRIEIEANTFSDPAGSGEATLMYGPDFNELIKNLANPGCMAIDNDSTITHIVFRTGVSEEGQVLVSDYRSDNPVWASFDSKTGTVTITSPAAVLYANAQASHMFRGFCLVREIENMKVINTSRAQNLSYFFHRCFNLKSVDLSNFDTSNCDSFGFMFSYCQSLESLDVSHFNTAKAITMANMFQHCEKVETIDVSGFKTDNVRSLDNTFSDCWALKTLDLSGWNTDQVTDTRSLFNRCKSIKELDIRKMSFPNTTRMTYMFYQMESLETLHFEGMDFSRWKAGTGTALVYMFQRIPNLKDLYLGDNGVSPDGITPSPFFTSNSDANGVRTASKSGKLTIHCHRDAVNWLAKGNLRWIHSGYKNQTPIDVIFLDYKTGEAYTPTWAAD
ncbi:MAG: BspA family leucine-rich repeat surface protein [Bacteroidales bacterium]|nr:BspA family leucine-rich repeat surface protein [Bacteroidales bacterium]